MEYSNEILKMWKDGEIVELALYCDDLKECEGTFFKWVDVEIGYEYPVFFCGNEEIFDKFKRLLINYGQDNRPTGK